jgi:lipopolysaccharide/colanic/teichoic acid biosynthesis glycosyltransferase
MYVSTSIPIPVVGLRPHRHSAMRRRFDNVVAKIKQQPRSRAARLAKRAIDIVLSAVGLVVLAPVMLAIALAVKARRFRFYKFRTMVPDAEARKRALEHLNEMKGPAFKIDRDPRITRLGRVLRKLSLDELPQLWNVLRGDMSLVGPRPPTPDEVERYTTRQIQRLSVMPGITGLWQVSGRSDIADFERWVDLDLTYARSWSMWLDLRILLKTVVVVARVRGAR